MCCALRKQNNFAKIANLTNYLLSMKRRMHHGIVILRCDVNFLFLRLGKIQTWQQDECLVMRVRDKLLNKYSDSVLTNYNHAEEENFLQTLHKVKTNLSLIQRQNAKN